MRTKRLHRRLLLATAILAVGAGLAAYFSDVLERANLSSVDWRFDVRGEREPPRDVLFVKLDDRSFDVLKEQSPVRRRRYATAIDRLKAAGARVIAVDVQFTEESPNPDDDNLLIESVRAAGNVVLATSEIGEGGTTRIFGGGEGLEYSRATPAHILVPNDPGGIVRRMSLAERGLVSFSLAAAEKFRGGRIVVPEGRGETPWIDFAGPPGRVRSVSLSDVVTGRFDPAIARGRIAVIGSSAPSLQDLQPTATSEEDDMPGAEIHANAIDTILRGFPLRDGPGWLDVLIIVLAGALAPLGTLGLGIVRGLLLTLGVTIAVAVGVQLAFDEGVIVSIVYAAGALVVATIATIVLHAITAAFEREQVRSTFARFVPESVVGEVLDKADGVRLGGTRRETTLLFSDLRGFTSFSERREPDLVIEILNRYLTEMSDAILDNGGTLVCYMGDGIMAAFGAPLDQADHADRAVEASVAMLERMRGFNRWMRDQGHGNGFKMGIGLNTGIVMSGNVGSERRLEYTTIGDVVNTAARIEGMTKGTPHQLFLSESTMLAMQSGREVVPAGDFEVRGREHKITLYTVAGTDAEPLDFPQSVAKGVVV
jgi:adenylate cyclase